MDKKQNQEYPYHVYFIHQNSTREGEKIFKSEEDAHSYAKELMGAESSEISLMEWDEQKKHLDVILDMPIRCSQEEFLLHIRGIGITEEEIQDKIDVYGEGWNQGNCAVVEGPSMRYAYKWDLAFDFEQGLHFVLAQY
jgi:hypothetical protein